MKLSKIYRVSGLCLIAFISVLSLIDGSISCSGSSQNTPDPAPLPAPNAESNTSGSAGSGGSSGSGGSAGGAVIGTGGTTGTGGSGGSTGTGGGSGGAGGTGGSGGSGGGSGSTGGTGGSGGTGGTGGTGGSGGSRGSGIPAPDSVSYTGTFPNSTGLFTSPMLSVTGSTRPSRTPSDVIRIYRQNTNTNLPLILAFPGTGNTTDEILSQFGVTGEGSLINGTEPAIFIAIPNTNQAEDWDHGGEGVYFNTTNDNPDTNPDLLLVRAVIKEAIRAYGINPARVYAAGFSNGAFFTELVSISLRNRIAGFAERSGGWARCLPEGKKAETVYTSSSTTCAAILSGPGISYTCTSSEAQPFAALPTTSSERVPAFISHDSQDDSVSVYYSCDLYQSMSSAGYQTDIDLRVLSPDSGGRHGVPADFITRAWNFLRTKSL